MKKLIKNEDGFGTTEAVLVLVIVLIVGFVGWFVYHSAQKANNTIDTGNQSNSSAQAVNGTSTKTANAAGTRAKEIATFLLTYTKTQSSSPLHTYVDKHVNDHEFTAAFKTAADNGTAFSTTASNPVYCSGTAPTAFKVTSSTLTGDNATVTLSPVTAANATPTQVPQLTLQYANNAWSVSQYACVAG